MPPFNARRCAAVLAGVWAGIVLGIGAISAPVAFAVLQRPVAGAVVGGMFAREAYLGLALGVVLTLFVRRDAKSRAELGQGSVFSTELLLVLGTLFCTLLGYFALQPLMTAARMGQGVLSFGLLHGASVLFFGAKGALAVALAWRLSRS